MKTDRRTDTCLNCDQLLSEDYKFCPNCGQKNSDNNVSVLTLLEDIFSNYFSLDSQFSKSFVPFFFKPGVLTNQFIEGKRVRFIQPVKLYVFTSLMFFFILTSVLSRNNFNFGDVFIDEENNRDSIATYTSGSISTSQQILDSLTAQTDSLNQTQTDTLTGFLSNTTLDGVIGLLQNESISDEAVLDSLNISIEGRLAKQFTAQVRKISRSGVSVFVPFLLKNLPIMMVLIVPILAFILKLLYIRRKELYITHLVHAVHLHAFAYFTYAFILLMMYFSPKILNASELFVFVGIGVVGIYGLISFFTVYKQGIFKTIVKCISVGLIYSFLMFLFLLGESFLSFMYF